MAVFGRILRGLTEPGAGAGTPWLVGDGSFGIGAVGESNYQDALEEIAGGRKQRGVRVTKTAELVLESDNPYDPKAVAVTIEGRKVGYLSRDQARLFRAETEMKLRPAGRVLCKAQIKGGWDRGPGDRGHFGVRLDIASGEVAR